MRPLSLYVHIPYCRTKCMYCDFNSYATQETPWERTLYALQVELEAYQTHPFAGRPLATLFVGGGTPSLFPPTFYAQLLDTVFALFPPTPDLEQSLEANPGTIQLDQLKGYRALGFNRISFGVQSLDANHLKTLTRLHGPEEGWAAPFLARDAGFDNISIDLMFGIPNQRLEAWEEELRRATTLPITHMSVYNLTPEEGSALVGLLEKGRMTLPDETYLVQMYEATRAILRETGFQPYEISNFARPLPCRHNLVYWRRQDYLGIGAGAHSFSAEGLGPPSSLSGMAHGTDRDGSLRGAGPAAHPPTKGGCRWSMIRALAPYHAATEAHRLPLEQVEWLSSQDAITERLLTELRLMEGLDLGALETLGGPRMREALTEAAAPYLEADLLRLGGARLSVTDAGVLVADAIIEQLSLAADAVGLSER